MLRLSAEVVTVEPDGRNAPTLSLVGGNGAFRQVQSTMTARSGGEAGRLMLFTASPQAYSSLRREPAGPRSGECRSRTGAASRGSDHEQRAVGLGPPTRPAQATGGREDSHNGGLREVHRRRAQAALPAPD